MKLYALMLTVFLFVSCSGKPQANEAINASAAENRKAKNKEIAAANEVSNLIRIAQQLEKQGRGMEIYRQKDDANNKRECDAAMEDGRKQIEDFETRTKNLPENLSVRLKPVLADIGECVSCSKKAMESCVKSRAAINRVIKENYPE